MSQFVTTYKVAICDLIEGGIMEHLIPLERIENRILLLRGQKVILDADLAKLYGVTTKALNQAVKRNADRFPPDFTFQLTKEEKSELVTNCDRFRNLKHSQALPRAFTEHGALMLASVLKSRTAIDVSIQIVRTFIRLREVMNSHRDLALKLNALEQKYDSQFRVVFDAIRALMEPSAGVKRRIGFARDAK